MAAAEAAMIRMIPWHVRTTTTSRGFKCICLHPGGLRPLSRQLGNQLSLQLPGNKLTARLTWNYLGAMAYDSPEGSRKQGERNQSTRHCRTTELSTLRDGLELSSMFTKTGGGQIGPLLCNSWYRGLKTVPHPKTNFKRNEEKLSSSS